MKIKRIIRIEAALMGAAMAVAFVKLTLDEVLQGMDLANAMGEATTQAILAPLVFVVPVVFGLTGIAVVLRLLWAKLPEEI